jgi:dienelactone hydrolase
MNTAVTLTAEEFKKIHNALCFAHADGIQKTVETIREALAGAYRQEEVAFDRKMVYFRRFQEENKLEAIWSMYELEAHGFLQDHPYPDTAFVCYQGGHVPVFGSTWGDIYRAADWAIRNSGDRHHIFIEGFELRNGNELHLVTGS